MARGGRASAGPASTGVVCPECAHVVSSADSVPRGPFFRDPRRWLPALVVVLMVLGQVGTWSTAAWWSSPVRTWISFEEAGGPTFEDLERAANGDRALATRLMHAIQRADRDSDPAAQIRLGEIVPPRFNVEGADQSPALYGWPCVWAAAINHIGPYSSTDMFRDLDFERRGATLTIRPGVLDGNPRELGISWAGLTVDTAFAVFVCWLLTSILRTSRSLVRLWATRACAFVLTLLLVLALLVQSGSDAPLWRFGLSQSFDSYQSQYPPAGYTSLSLQTLRVLAATPEGTIEAARELSRVAHTAQFPLERKIIIQLGQETPHDHVNFKNGWPFPATLVWVMKNGAPLGTGVQRGTWSIRQQDGTLELSLNRGAWPGIGGFITIYPAETMGDIVLMGLVWWAARRAAKLYWNHRSRGRFARGLCVKCGYDLSGLKAPAK